MRFLKTIFGTLIAVIAVLFAINNWTRVTVKIWDGKEVDSWLPLLLLLAFLLGVLPTLVLHRATRWQMRRKLENAQRSLAELQRLQAVPSPSSRLDNISEASSELKRGQTVLPAAAPIAVPPGGL